MALIHNYITCVNMSSCSCFCDLVGYYHYYHEETKKKETC